MTRKSKLVRNNVTPSGVWKLKSWTTKPPAASPSETTSRHRAYGNSISSTRALTQTVRNSVTPWGVWKESGHVVVWAAIAGIGQGILAHKVSEIPRGRVSVDG